MTVKEASPDGTINQGTVQDAVIVRSPDPAGLVRAHLQELTGPGIFLQVDPPSLL